MRKDAGWTDEAYMFVRGLLVGYTTARSFTADDIWRAGLPPPPSGRAGRALGPVLMRLKRDGLIIPTSEFRTSERDQRHGAPVRVWRTVCQ